MHLLRSTPQGSHTAPHLTSPHVTYLHVHVFTVLYHCVIVRRIIDCTVLFSHPWFSSAHHAASRCPDTLRRGVDSRTGEVYRSLLLPIVAYCYLQLPIVAYCHQQLPKVYFTYLCCMIHIYVTWSHRTAWPQGSVHVCAVQYMCVSECSREATWQVTTGY